MTGVFVSCGFNASGVAFVAVKACWKLVESTRALAKNVLTMVNSN